MPDTAFADPDAGLSPAELAARHGLGFAGTRPTLGGYARQLWAYRHFIVAYSNARVSASFSLTRLGRLWQVLTPLTNAAVYYLIFGVVLATRHSTPNFIAYLCTGLFIFVFTQTVAQAGVASITGNMGLIRALHFPRACLPIAIALIELQNIGASMLVLTGIVLLTGEPLTWEWLLIFPALALQMIFNTGLGMFLARLGSKMTDLKQVIPFVMRTWMYGSGVFYASSLFAEHLPRWAAVIVEANPMLVYIELIRHAMLENVKLSSTLPHLWLLAVVWALVVFVGGYVYFWRGEQEYGRG
ncbi:ABC transporter permease [Micromonospora mirobrigensis]|uniref:Transport permease protein n=1 Tax=Micromonospora mirobrigensis TaxID=262898 RepID=A0A1C4UG68_9ACTN|nr:ABC transporter permease [Micromonospora mirobrigensis]SCE70695.1 teichoic acid transport system permease protein [Micromonospora mirobrigensis]